MREDKVKKMVREGYAKAAKERMGSCCSPSTCCDKGDVQNEYSKRIGYSDEELKSVPKGANVSFGCGNPVALASLKKGETVLDLGSGGGFDCFLAAREVGKTGKVIGVDMTPEMLDKARDNAHRSGLTNVEFRLGEIENLPVADNSVDVIISNCVINLSPDKRKVFKEAFRVIKPGGRLMVSDIVLEKELPSFVKESAAAYLGCVAGAMKKEEYMGTIAETGFEKVRIVAEKRFPAEFILDEPGNKAAAEKLGLSMKKVKEMAESILSIQVEGSKPTQKA